LTWLVISTVLANLALLVDHEGKIEVARNLEFNALGDTGRANPCEPRLISLLFRKLDSARRLVSLI